VGREESATVAIVQAQDVFFVPDEEEPRPSRSFARLVAKGVAGVTMQEAGKKTREMLRGW
jgi:hypothetical protein